MLTVRDIAAMPGLGLAVVGGSDGLDNPVSWLHVSELEDPTEFLEGGEFLLTTGLGVGELASTQRSYVRRLAEHRLAGLGFGLGFGFAETPPALLAEADKLGFPVVSVPYEVPFVAITKAAVSYLANEQLEQLERALAVHERLADAVLEGRGWRRSLQSFATTSTAASRSSTKAAAWSASVTRSAASASIAPSSFPWSATRRRRRPRGTLERRVRRVRPSRPPPRADGACVRASRRRAVSAAELRLAGDLLDDLEDERLDDRETARRMAAFGLEADREYARRCSRFRATATSSDRLREDVAEELDA